MFKNKNVRLLCGMELLQGLVFYMPIATLYRQAIGIGLTQIALLESISLILSLALEMPWGMVADWIGYKNTMRVCSTLFFVSKVIFWRADGFGAFLAERILLAVVISGLSGVDSAMLYLSCPKKEWQQQLFAVYEGLGTAGMLAASLLYSICFGNDYRLAGFWTMIAYGAAMVLSFFLKEPSKLMQKKEKGSLLLVIRSVLVRPELLLLLFAFGCFRETHQIVTVFLNQLQYGRAQIAVAWLGVLSAGMQILGFLGMFSDRLTKTLGECKTAILLMGCGALACVMLALTSSPAVSIFGVGLMSLAGSLLFPLQAVTENRQVRTAARATELSVYAMLSDSLAAGINVVFGRAADVSLPFAFWLGAGFCLAACAAYIVQACGEKNIK